MSSMGEARSMINETLSVFGTVVDFVYVNILNLENKPPVRVCDHIANSSDEEFEKYVLQMLSFRLGRDTPVRGLSEHGVAKRAVLQLALYCRLQKMRHAMEVSDIYQALFKATPPIITPSVQIYDTVGDYLVSEMLVSCNAIRYVHVLTQKFPYKDPMRFRNTYVTHDDTSRVLELLFMRLVRHLVAFNEGLMEALGFRSRFMMSLAAAEHFASRSLAYEQGVQVKSRKASIALAETTSAVAQNGDAGATDLLLAMKLSDIHFESPEVGEVQDLTSIRRLYVTYATKWVAQAKIFMDARLEKELHNTYKAILDDIVKVAETPVDPKKTEPFDRIHNRAALAVKVAQQLIEIYWAKVCNDEEEMTVALQDKMSVSVTNAYLYAGDIFVPLSQ